jgi:hypothetical protein
MEGVMIWDPSERLLTVIAITVLAACGVQYLNLGRRREKFNEKIILYGFASMVFSFAVERLLIFIAEFFIPGTYSNNTYYGDYDEINSDLIFLFYKSSSIAWAIGYVLFFLAFEKNVGYTRYVLTISQAIFIVLMIATPWSLFTIIYNNIVIFYTNIVFFMILMLYSKKTKLEFSAISSMLLFGYLLITQGHELGTMLSKSHIVLGVFNARSLVVYISPTFYIIGTLVCISPTVINPKYFSQALIFWLVFGISSILVNLYLLVVNLLKAVTYYVVFYIVITIIVFYSLYQVINTIKTQTYEDFAVIESKEYLQDIYGMFTKPKEISEEDVTYYKEQKICLVCKNKVSRLSYICPQCDALYCVKCSNALSNIENACWVCEAPFDVEKPVHMHAPKQEEIEVEEAIQGKVKKKKVVNPP